ncbi:MAG: 6-phosphogluconolactonase [Acidimicrobiales bacterium]|jgi:6-phosphogluconolactonase
MPPTPPTGELRVVGDVPTAFGEVVAAEFAAVRQAGAGKAGDGRFRMALSGGDTARACYEHLATIATIDWAAVDLLLGDERCVPPDDAAANQRLVRETLLVPTGGVASFRPMDCDDPAAYEALLSSQPPLDLIHLGLGPDGHTASLFPGSTALRAPAASLVVRTEDPTGRNPLPRLTFTFSAIGRGRLVVFTVAGSAKHDALLRVLDGEDLPAARVRAARVLWLCDHAALAG